MFLWNIAVTSLAEVWIEIGADDAKSAAKSVTSLAEVWIEISNPPFELAIVQSLPLRKCGLKSVNNGTVHELVLVTSLAEVWIEILHFLEFND